MNKFNSPFQSLAAALPWAALPMAFFVDNSSPNGFAFWFLLVVLASVSTITDLTAHKIPNLLCYSVFFAACSLQTLSLLKVHAAHPLTDSPWFGLLACLMITLPGWLMGMIGGGDVKLSACFGVLLGPQVAIAVLLAAHLIAAAFVLSRVIYQLLAKVTWRSNAQAAPERVPMAGFYACGLIVVIATPIITERLL